MPVNFIIERLAPNFDETVADFACGTGGFLTSTLNYLERNITEYSEDEKLSVIAMNPLYGGNELDNIRNNFPADLRGSETADLFIALILYRLKYEGRAAVIIPDGFLFGADGSKLELKKHLLNQFNLHTVIRLPSSVFSPYTSITTNILFFNKGTKSKGVWFYRVDMPHGYKHFSKIKPMLLEHFAECVDWWNNRRVITHRRRRTRLTQKNPCRKSQTHQR